jgi:hypothetical protein
MLKTNLEGKSITFHFSLKDSPLYGESVTLAKAVYREVYQASIQPSPDCFIACVDEHNGELVACAGLSFAAKGQVFSEQYLDIELDLALQAVFGYPVSRDKAVEVSSLATRLPNAGSELVRIIPIACWYLGMQAILCTATRRLQLIFKHQKLPFSAIAEPDPKRLKHSSGSDWGTYYETDPQTGIVRLDQIGHLFQSYCGKYDLFDGPHAPAENRLRVSNPALIPA